MSPGSFRMKMAARGVDADHSIWVKAHSAIFTWSDEGRLCHVPSPLDKRIGWIGISNSIGDSI